MIQDSDQWWDFTWTLRYVTLASVRAEITFNHATDTLAPTHDLYSMQL